MPALADLCIAIVDCEHKTAPKAESGFPLVRTTDIGRGRIDLSGVQRVDGVTYEEWTRRAIPQPGDLILAREAPVGNVALVTPGMEPVLGQRTVLLRPDPERVDADYLCYRLLADDVQSWMRGVANGATVPHLNMDDIRALPLPQLPSLDDQRRIGAALAAFDDLLEVNRQQIRILEAAGESIFREWITRARFPGHERVEIVDSVLGPLPRDWEIAPIGEIVQTVGGGTPSKERAEFWSEPSIDWYTPTDLTRRSAMFAFGSSDRINQLGLAKSSAKLFPARTVMMTSRATIGEIAIATGPAATNQGFISCVPNDRLSEFHIYFWLKDNVALFHSLAGGATFKELRKSMFRDLPIAVPSPAAEATFNASAGPIVDLIERLLRVNALLAEVRDRLLPYLISGDADVSALPTAQQVA